MRLMILMCCSILGTGCDHTAGLPTVSTPVPELPEMSVPGARVAVIRDDGEPGTGPATYRILVDAKGLQLGSYQGEIRYESSAFHVEAATGSDSASVFVNSEPGRLRFAVFSPTGIVHRTAVVLTAIDRTTTGPANLTASLGAAGTVDGRSLPRHELHSTGGVFRLARR